MRLTNKEKHLQQNDPEAYESLTQDCSGVTDEEIKEAEEAIGGHLPQDLVESLKRHNLPGGEVDDDNPLMVFKTYGYLLSLNEMVEAYQNYRDGPLATRFSDSTDSGEMENLIPIFSYDQDRTYFFTCVDLISKLVCYLDYGDLVGPPSGRVIAWSFKDYLSSLADNLSSGTYHYKDAFPAWSFGFHGTNEILSLMPVRRTLQFDQDVFIMDGIPLRKVLQEAIDNPNLHIAEKVQPPQPIAETDLPPIPTGCTLLDLHWDDTYLPSSDVTVQESGKLLVAKSYNVEVVSKEAITKGRNYWEVIIGPKMSIFEIGITNRKKDDNKADRYNMGYNGRSISGTRYKSLSSYGTQIECFENGKELKEGERVGVLVDMDNSIVEFYRNRVFVHKFNLIHAIATWGEGSMAKKMKVDLSGPNPFPSLLPFVHCHMSKLSFNKV